MLSVCPSRPGRELPGSKSLFFCFAKSKVTKRKGDPVRRPLRGTLRCSVQPGSETTRLRLKQVSALIRLALRFSAPLQGLGGKDKEEVRRLASSASRLGLPESEFTPQPVEAGPSSADGGGRSGQTCLSRRRVVWTAAGVEQHRLPVAKRRDPDGGSPFFPLGFFGETKKGNSPAGARPGLAVKGNASTPWSNEC